MPMHRKDLRADSKVHNRIAKYLESNLPVVTHDTVLLSKPERPRRGPHVVLDAKPLCDGNEPHPVRCGLCPIAHTCKGSIIVD